MFELAILFTVVFLFGYVCGMYDEKRRAKKTIAQFLAFAAEKRATDGWWCSTCKAREGRPHQATCQRQGIVTEADCQKEPHA